MHIKSVNYRDTDFNACVQNSELVTCGECACIMFGLTPVEVLVNGNIADLAFLYPDPEVLCTLRSKKDMKNPKGFLHVTGQLKYNPVDHIKRNVGILVGDFRIRGKGELTKRKTGTIFSGPISFEELKTKPDSRLSIRELHFAVSINPVSTWYDASQQEPYVSIKRKCLSAYMEVGGTNEGSHFIMSVPPERILDVISSDEEGTLRVAAGRKIQIEAYDASLQFERSGGVLIISNQCRLPFKVLISKRLEKPREP